MDRTELLNQIITFGDFREKAFTELAKLTYDSKIEFFEVNNEILTAVLAMFISDSITANDLEEWANFIECRDDINYSKVDGYIFALANSEIMGDINKEKIFQMLQVLSSS